MNKVLDFLKDHKYLMVALVLVGISIVLSITYSNYIVTSNNHKAAEMYIGTLKYSMTIDGTTKNTLSVPSGETIVDVTITNENPIDTYYKLIYQNNSNVSITYYEGYELDSSNNAKAYSKPSDKITSNNTNSIKLKITNSSTSSQKVTFKIVGGFSTNTLDDVTVPTGYTTINTIETPSPNTYFCTTTDTLTQGAEYVNGQYTYRYKQEGDYASSGLEWYNISTDGWGVQLTDKASTNAVTSKVCTYINNKPITSMSYMFTNSQATILDISNVNTSNVINMESMLCNTEATTLDLSDFNTSNVTTMSGMFYNSQATTLDVSSFDTSNVTDMSLMFSNSKATTLDVSNFDTSNVTSMGSMFDNSQATEIKGLSTFNTSNVTNMIFMFSYSKATTLDVSNFDTSNVTNMNGMFSNTKATTLDLSNFNTSKVTNMRGMFSDSQATTIDLSSFDTFIVTNMEIMFYGTSNLKTIYASNKFNTDNVTSSYHMFTGSTNLVGGAGTKYNSSHVDKTYARIDGGTSNPGYFTDIADKPSIFSTDSWATIVASVKAGNTRGYKVGDTKKIDLGTYGTHTLRVANTSTPSECSTAGFSQTACGFVLEFADIITTHKMNDPATNVGGWPASSMYAFVNNNIYNSLPSELKNAIIDTTVVSGHGSTSGETNFTSTDKLYLLAPKEIYTDIIDGADTAKDLTRTLDYYTSIGVTTSSYSGAIKKNGTSASDWWLRAAHSNTTNIFFRVNFDGDWIHTYAGYSCGVAPAFRLR